MRLITGKAGTGKTYTCLNEIKKNVEEAFNKPLIYIVPEQYSYEAEKELIEVIGRDGIINNTQVLSFKRLSYKIFADENFSGEYIERARKKYAYIFFNGGTR